MVILRPKQRQDITGYLIFMGSILAARELYGFKLFAQLYEFDMPYWTIVVQYTIGLASVFINVIPKYLYFGGAKRHLNDQLMKKKSYFTRNYIRLLLHIISGASNYIIIGLYILFEKQLAPIMPVEPWRYFVVGWDTVHNVTIILMTRNHDGIYILRSGNVLLAFLKCLFSIELLYCNTLAEMRPLFFNIWFYTQGFAGTRLFSFLVAMGEIICGYEFDSLRENWYSLGLSGAQLYIFLLYPRACLYYCASMICAAQFQHELWTRRDNYQMRAVASGALPMLITLISVVYPYEETCITTDDMLTNVLYTCMNNTWLHLAYAIFLIWFNFHFLGLYYKRLPLKGVDFITLRKKGDKKKVKKAPEVKKINKNDPDADELDDDEDSDDEVINDPAFLQNPELFNDNIFGDFDPTMDPKLLAAINMTCSLESSASSLSSSSPQFGMTPTTSDAVSPPTPRPKRKKRKKLTENSVGRIQSMEERVSHY